MKTPQRVLILGAAGRDFHDFNVYWRDREDCVVVGFTAAQIPDIAGRTYPPVLTGPRYPQGLPIYAEEDLPRLIRDERVDVCVLAYSDLNYDTVMHKAALVNACGANFTLLGARATMLESRRPVISVCAVRTGCGKSQTSRAIVRILKDLGLRVAAVRHPMPYGDLSQQICQRFARMEDLSSQHCTIEEREEYEPHIAAGNVVFAGVDYARILAEAEKEADVVLWDGGNNDTPFYRPALHIVVADPHRPGHELRYYPGETNVRIADLVIVNKVDTARPEDVATVRRNVQRVNPRATILDADSPLTVRPAATQAMHRVLVVEDGPTVTHGEMPYGAGAMAGRRLGLEFVDPRPFAVGSIRETFAKYPHLRDVLPAMGYGDRQIAELQETINACACDAVLIGTPIDLARMLTINKPALRVTYELSPHEPAVLEAAVRRAVGREQGNNVTR
ncbi:MAG: GTPase [Phycisphaerales bacterium]|nr:GTPase [Phycisphaerales bacterium]